MDFQLQMTIKQAQVLNESVEFFSRILMGQLEEVAEHTPRLSDESFDDWLVRRDKVRYLLKEAKEIYTGFYHPGTNFGIHSPRISDSARVAFDLHQVVRQCLHRSENPNPQGMARWSTWNDDPMRTSTTETTLAKMSKIIQPKGVL